MRPQARAPCTHRSQHVLTDSFEKFSKLCPYCLQFSTFSNSVSIIARQSALPPVECHHGGKSLRFDRLVALSHPKSGKSQTSTPQSSKVHPTHVFVSSFLFAADSYSGTRLLTQFAYYSSESRSVTISSMLTELHGRLNVEVA